MFASSAREAGIVNETNSAGGSGVGAPGRSEENTIANQARRPGAMGGVDPIGGVLLCPSAAETCQEISALIVSFKTSDETVFQFTNPNCSRFPEFAGKNIDVLRRTSQMERIHQLLVAKRRKKLVGSQLGGLSASATHTTTLRKISLNCAAAAWSTG